MTRRPRLEKEAGVLVPGGGTIRNGLSSIEETVDRDPTDDEAAAMRSRSPRHDLPLSEELAAVSARMSGFLLSGETVESALALISSLARETIPGSSGAGVSVIDEQRRRSSGSTDDRVRAADRLQYELDQGPCLTATAEHGLVRIDDVAEDQRWPRWSEAVVPLGLRAAMSTALVAGHRSLGAIKVYADEPRTFDHRSEQLLTLFAAQAAMLVAHVQRYERSERLSDGLRQAIHARDGVSMAKGVLMGRHAVDEDTAFGMLMARCEQEGSTLAEAASGIIESAVRRRRR
jgi:GAF domain-containing protein